ncbi:hypothetical protein FA95DRAFT_184594 [Auriscalpium vulgare]|uniref:Uncharacterized protein n=1 Tax=Auriscalpium vulgare TaxID=40419 RepID=A0ACB8RLF1_9AGAM|nr:hypothetical protein FA95DRAFT_184594 [Auriscalpium vulgare]
MPCCRCDRLYHQACVGVKKGDPCLEEDVHWECPICFAYRNNPDKRPKPVKGQMCHRPRCRGGSSDEFFVYRIIGRGPPLEAGSKHSWLVMWEGYDSAQATWETGIGLRKQFFTEFAARAKEERERRANEEMAKKERVLTPSDGYVLLNEAQNAKVDWRRRWEDAVNALSDSSLPVSTLNS